jgi:hypothetical protein
MKLNMDNPCTPGEKPQNTRDVNTNDMLAVKNVGFFMVILSALTFLIAYSTYADDGTIVEVRLTDNGQALINPDMGWTMHYYSNIIANYGSKLEPSDTLEDFPGLSTVYLRVPWAFIEPEEGNYNWSLLDTPAQRWIDKGKRTAIRLTTSENWIRYATPEWVKEAGAKGYFYQYGQGRKTTGPSWDPDFNDPVYLEKLDTFLANMAKRYDNNPNVAFIDIGTFGLWGEGHTHASSQVPDDILYSTQKKHIDIDLHLKHFKNTLLCISDDFVGHNKPGRKFPITDYALKKGITLRDDSIMVQPPPNSWYHAELASSFWPKFPVILEHQHYGSSLKRNAWDKDLWLKSVEDYHASYMSIHWWPRVLLNENKDAIDKINRRLGYRICIKEASWPESIKIGVPFEITTTWINAGVAPCYPGGYIAFTIKDDKQGIISTHTNDTFNVSDLKPTSPGKEEVKTIITELNIAPLFKQNFKRNVKPGQYDLYISVGQLDSTPTIHLPHNNEDNNKRYRLGKINLLPR